MIFPITKDLTALRGMPFAASLAIKGLDLTAPSFGRMQVRLYPDAPGGPLLDLNIGGGGNGISLSVTTDGGVPTSTFLITIVQATIDALLPFPNGGDPGDVVTLSYDIVLAHPSLFNGSKQRWQQGTFNIVPGVTK